MILIASIYPSPLRPFSEDVLRLWRAKIEPKVLREFDLERLASEFDKAKDDGRAEPLFQFAQRSLFIANQHGGEKNLLQDPVFGLEVTQYTYAYALLLKANAKLEHLKLFTSLFLKSRNGSKERADLTNVCVQVIEAGLNEREFEFFCNSVLELIENDIELEELPDIVDFLLQDSSCENEGDIFTRTEKFTLLFGATAINCVGRKACNELIAEKEKRRDKEIALLRAKKKEGLKRFAGTVVETALTSVGKWWLIRILFGM